MSWVWSHSASRGVDRLVLLAIADASEDDGGNAWPSTATLAAKAGVDERTVQRSVRRLVESGELTMKPNAGKKGTNVYRVTMTPGSVPPRQSAAPDSAPPLTPGTESPPAERHPGTQSPNPRQSATPGGGTAPPEPSLTRPEPSEDARKRATRVPEPFTVTDDMRGWLDNERLPTGWAQQITEEFVDYWRGVPGEKGRKVDWAATWRNWLRREARKSPPQRSASNDLPAYWRKTQEAS